MLANRKRLELQDALHRVGCSPGERTFTNDWVFWHGLQLDKKAEACVKSRMPKKAKHGEGCGGSQEWINILRQRRARANRTVQQKKILVPTENGNVALAMRVWVCQVSAKISPGRRCHTATLKERL